jgi:hypothetical protein
MHMWVCSVVVEEASCEEEVMSSNPISRVVATRKKWHHLASTGWWLPNRVLKNTIFLFILIFLTQPRFLFLID